MAFRKDLADITVCTQVAADINHCFMERRVTLRDDLPGHPMLKSAPFDVEDVYGHVSQKKLKKRLYIYVGLRIL